MKILISAAEMSSDQHAAIVARALAELQGESVQFFGIGGPYLRSMASFKCIEKAENLRAMGISEVIQKIGFIRSTLARLIQAVEQEEPDLILTLDYPDFHFAFMKAIQQRGLAPKALKICGIPPKVWVWRSRRVEKIRKYYDGVWSIFPFEKTYYESRGIPVIQEGNPLLWSLMEQRVSPVESVGDREIITVMPGSRDSEWKHLLPLIPDTLQQFSARIARPILVLVPIPIGLDEAPLRSALKSNDRIEYRFIPGGTAQALRASRIGLIKSGTSTLEAVMLGCAPVIFYRMNPLSEKFFEWIMRYSGPVGLPNILLGIRRRERSIFPEFLGREATPHALASALQQVWNSDLRDPIEKVRREMRHEGGVPQKIARQILSWSEHRPRSAVPVQSSLWTGVASWLWSTINALRRWTYKKGWRVSQPIPVPSLLVANLQAGGSGKTPVVLELAKEAVQRGLCTALVSRGYGRQKDQDWVVVPHQKGLTASDLGDEPLEILSQVPQLYAAVGSDRVRGVQRLLEAAKSRKDRLDLVIFDDGFQNLSFRASRTLLIKTPLTPFQALYRDFESQSKYADWVLENPGPQLQWEAEFLPSHPIWLICGLAHPQRVYDFYSNQGVKIDRFIPLPDHYRYQESEVKAWLSQAKKQHRKIYITAKDAAKWKPFGVLDSVGVLRLKLVDRAWMHEVFDRLLKSP